MTRRRWLHDLDQVHTWSYGSGACLTWVRGAGPVDSDNPSTMNARVFQEWIGRLALLAALMLVAVPTAGRLVHASGAGHDAAAHLARQDGHQVHVASTADGRAPLAPLAAPGDADCDYCPLLSSLIAATCFATMPAALLPPAATPASPAAPRLPWLHPSGLGSRGPPLFG